MKKNLLLIFFIYLLNNAVAQTQWTPTATPPGGSVWGMAAIGNNIFAGATNGGVYFSADNGITWTKRNGAFPGMSVYVLAVNGTDLFAGTGGGPSGPVPGSGGGVFKSSDNGLTWTNITPSGMDQSTTVRSLVISGTDIYAGTYGGQNGVFKSSLSNISSSSWTAFNNGLTNKDLRSLRISGTNIYAGTYGNGVWVSPLTTAVWSLTSASMPVYSDYIQALDVIGPAILAGNISGNPVLYRSVDNGLNWTQSSTPDFGDKPVYALINDGNNVYVGTEGMGVFMSDDNGATWTKYNDGFKDNAGNWYCNQINVRSFVFSGDKFFAGTDCGVWKRDAISLHPVAGINESFHFYPNPAKNNITVKVKNDLVGSDYSIVDQSGRLVQAGKITSPISNINIRSLNTGMYIFRFTTDKKQKFKFLKQ